MFHLGFTGGPLVLGVTGAGHNFAAGFPFPRLVALTPSPETQLCHGKGPQKRAGAAAQHGTVYTGPSSGTSVLWMDEILHLGNPEMTISLQITTKTGFKLQPWFPSGVRCRNHPQYLGFIATPSSFGKKKPNLEVPRASSCPPALG